MPKDKFVPKGLTKSKFYAKIKPVKVYGEFFRQLVDGRNGAAGKRLANKFVKTGRLNMTMLKNRMWKEYQQGKPIYMTPVIKTASHFRRFVRDVYELGA